MSKNKTTSPKVATDASKLLRKKTSPVKVKEVAGSDLSQAKKKSKKK